MSSAAILAWLATQGADLDIPTVVFLAPAGVTLLMAVLATVRLVRTRAVRKYLLELESMLGRRPELGWEAKFSRQKAMLAVLSAMGWVALFGADVYAGLTLEAYAAGDLPYDARDATTT